MCVHACVYQFEDKISKKTTTMRPVLRLVKIISMSPYLEIKNNSICFFFASQWIVTIMR